MGTQWVSFQKKLSIFPSIFLGFTIRSLNAVNDVKSSLKADRNLLHYVVELIEQQFPDLMKLKKELNLLYDATKFT